MMLILFSMMLGGGVFAIVFYLLAVLHMDVSDRWFTFYMALALLSLFVGVLCVIVAVILGLQSLA